MNDASGNTSNYLVTGRPGVGKTTFIRRFAEKLSGIPVAGFYTAEIRREGKRLGFRITTFDGLDKIFAHTDFPSVHRVSRYGVNLSVLEEVIAHLHSFSLPENGVWLIDEIGKMESLSAAFRHFVEIILDQPQRVVATISLFGGGWIGEVRNRSDVRIIQLNERNRGEQLETLLQKLQTQRF